MNTASSRLRAVLLACAFGASAVHAAPETFASDADHTFARFAFNHLGYSEQQGRFDRVAATLVLDREARTGRLSVRIDPASVSTGSAAFDATLRGAAFFDVANHPDITFTADRFGFDRLDRIDRVEGTLTIKGRSQPVTLTVTRFHCMMHPLLRREACGANATATLSRSAFGLGKFTPLVGDEVTVTVAIEVLKQD